MELAAGRPLFQPTPTSPGNPPTKQSKEFKIENTNTNTKKYKYKYKEIQIKTQLPPLHLAGHSANKTIKRIPAKIKNTKYKQKNAQIFAGILPKKQSKEFLKF